VCPCCQRFDFLNINVFMEHFEACVAHSGLQARDHQDFMATYRRIAADWSVAFFGFFSYLSIFIERYLCVSSKRIALSVCLYL
jgi:hypothetical protein